MYNTIDYSLPQEEWRDIPKYEGIYQASSFGRIRSVDGKVTFSTRAGERHWQGKIIKPKGSLAKTGYRVTLWKDKSPKDWLVARLVCMSFYGESLLTVNHIDGNRFNNSIDNLEWLSLADNIRHAFNTGLMPTNKEIDLINVETNERTHYRSLSKASEAIGRNNGYISLCLLKNKEITSSCGNVYKYVLK